MMFNVDPVYRHATLASEILDQIEKNRRVSSHETRIDAHRRTRARTEYELISR